MTPSLRLDPDGDLWLCRGDHATCLGPILHALPLVPPGLVPEWWGLLDDWYDRRTGYAPMGATGCLN